QSVYLDGIQILKKTVDFIIIESYRILVGILFSQIRIILIIQFVQVLIFWLFPSAFHHRNVERSSVVIGRQQFFKPFLLEITLFADLPCFFADHVIRIGLPEFWGILKGFFFFAKSFKPADDTSVVENCVLIITGLNESS